MTLAAPPRPDARPVRQRVDPERGAPTPRPVDAPPALLPAELALAATTLAAVAGYVRVFEGTGFLPKLVAAAVAAHLVAAVLRRRGAPAAVSALVLYVAAVLVGAWALFPQHTWFGIPTLATARALVDAVSSSWDRIGVEVAPVDPEPGFLVVAFAATWIGAAVADRAAFRWWMGLVALVPAAALFVVGAVLARTGTRAVFAVAFVAASLAFLLLQRQLLVSRRLRWRWMALGARPGRRATFITGGALIVLCCVVGASVGPRLPGGDGSSLVDWRPGDGGGQRQTVSPLVDIRSRLVDQSDQVLFTVEAPAPAYWRTTSLDIFDGRVWRSEGSFAGADGALEAPEDEQVGSDRLVQRVQVQALDQIWLPAAFRPVEVDAGGTPIRYDPVSASLIVDGELDSSDGAAYDVTSAVPDHDPAELAAATGPPPEEVADRYLALPAAFSPTAAGLAQEATAGATGPYAQALALESFFRDGFEYSLEVEGGHDASAIDAFLARRSGYCEQFAGTYAAMARSLGIPSRVAVGYTPGDVDPARPDRFVVRGRDAHAWPEVWLTGIGWVSMEPTPTREEPAPATTTTTQPPPTDPSTPPDPTAVPTTAAPAAEGAAGSGPPSDERTGVVADLAGLLARWRLLLLASALVALAVLVVVGVPLLADHRRRRLVATGAPSAQVRNGWAFAVHDLAAGGLRPRPEETPSELLGRAAARGLLDGAAAARVASAVDAALYAPGEGDDERARRTTADLDGLAREVDVRLGVVARWRRRLAPRVLLLGLPPTVRTGP